MFHTQEKRSKELTAPIPTNRDDAWLGSGYYFWYYEQDGVYWGSKSKRRTGYYEIYKANIEFENILDTVFNEEHYTFWINNIEKAIAIFLKKERGAVTLKYINDFFKDKGLFEQVAGVLFQDISSNPEFWVVKKFQYKKRIQLAVYNLDIISNFALHFDGQCV